MSVRELGYKSGLPTADEYVDSIKAMDYERKAKPYSPPLTVRSIDGKPCIFVAEIDGREVGRMSITVMPLVHDMEIADSPIQRKIADALFFYASGKVKASGFDEVLCLVGQDNTRMQAYVMARAVREEENSVFVMGVR